MTPLFVKAALVLGSGAIALFAASKSEEKKKYLSPADAAADRGVPLSIVVAGFQAAQGNDAPMMRAVAFKVKGSTFGGALQSVASIVDARNLPNKTESMSGAMVALVQILFNAQTDKLALNLYADGLDKVGLHDFAQKFRDKASVVPPSLPGMPPELAAAVKTALASGDPQALSSVAYQLEQAGFPQAAAELRKKAQDASRASPAAPASTITAIQPNMPADLAAEVARVLRDCSDPKVLNDLAARLRTLGYSDAADQVAAKATQVLATLEAAAAMQQIQTQVLPEVQIVEKSPAEQAAHASWQNLWGVLKGNTLTEQITYAKAHYDANAVKKFQSLTSLTQDGKPGPKTLLTMARFEMRLPYVLFWPRGTTSATVHTYRSNLETLALEAEQQGKTDRAAELRASAQREVGAAAGLKVS